MCGIIPCKGYLFHTLRVFVKTLVPQVTVPSLCSRITQDCHIFLLASYPVSLGMNKCRWLGSCQTPNNEEDSFNPFLSTCHTCQPKCKALVLFLLQWLVACESRSRFRCCRRCFSRFSHLRGRINTWGADRGRESSSRPLHWTRGSIP